MMSTLDRRLTALESAATPEPINFFVTFRGVEDKPLARDRDRWRMPTRK